MPPADGYPFVPKTTSRLLPGQFWGIPLAGGRFACGRVLELQPDPRYGARTFFVAGLLDWLGANPPTADDIAGASVLEVGRCHVRAIEEAGGAILGLRPLDLYGITPPPTVPSVWGTRYAQLRAERLLLHGDEPPPFEIRPVSSPLTDQMLRPIRARRATVQFNRPLSVPDFERLASWLKPQPDVRLRAYGAIEDLEFLRHFPFLRRFAVDAAYDSLRSLVGLAHLPEDVLELTIGRTAAKLDLGVLSRFVGLRTLYLEGQTKGIEVLSLLTALEELTLRSITLPDLALLLNLRNLLALDLKLGGTQDLRLVPRIGHLRYLEIWMVKGVTDISPVGELPELAYLFLQALRRVEHLPDLSRSHGLRRVHLETMKELRDFRPLALAPALEELLLVDMPQVAPSDLACLASHPTLRSVTVGLGSRRKNDAARALLRLPDVPPIGGGWREVAGLPPSD